MEATQHRNSLVICSRVKGELIVQTNGKQSAEQGNPRCEALWQGAIEQLLNFWRMQARGHKGERFGLTNEGDQLADQGAAGGRAASQCHTLGWENPAALHERR